MPARSIKRCETICASLGFSRSSGKKYRERRMAPRRESRQSSTDADLKTPEGAKNRVTACGILRTIPPQTKRTGNWPGPSLGRFYRPESRFRQEGGGRIRLAGLRALPFLVQRAREMQQPAAAS